MVSNYYMDKPKKVIIIEDDEYISKIYEIKLTLAGIATKVVTSGDEALASIITEKPDLIILDLMLPKKNGFTVLEDIKKDPVLAKIPVIILSNLGQKSDKERALALGANEYLVKVDYPIRDVVGKVKEYFSA